MVKYVSGSDQVIHVDVSYIDGKFNDVLSFVYAWNTRLQRVKLWAEFISFRSTCVKPWLVIDDFNAYIADNGKIGYEGVSIEPCEEMRSCLFKCSLEDLPGVRVLHTWCNNQDSSS